MRTTLVIQDDLLAAAKKRAADRRTNVSAIVNEALRAALRDDAAGGARAAFEMPTFRPRGAVRPVDVTPSELEELQVAEDLEGYRA